jgi:hypothetical protein
MDVHSKIIEKLPNREKNKIMEQYLTMKNKLGLNYFKPEMDGIKQEKEDIHFCI